MTVVTNLKYAREKRQPKVHKQPKLKEGDLVLVIDHTAKAFQPRFIGSFRIVTQKRNQVEVRPTEGGQTTKFHVTKIKKLFPADQAISQLPDYNNFERLTKIRVNPRDIPDLDWQLALELNTVPSLHHIAKIDNCTTSIKQFTPRVSTEIILELIRDKMTKIKAD